MEFNDVIKQFSERILSLKDTITTEESTKMSLVVPLFQLLGYDVFNPNEFCPEYIADHLRTLQEYREYVHTFPTVCPVYLSRCLPITEI